MRRCASGIGTLTLTASLLLAGCGSGSSLSANGETGRSADQIVADAAAAIRSVHSYHLVFDGHDSSGTSRYDITVAAADQVSGTITASGVTAQFRLIGGKAYFQGKAFIAKFAGPQEAALIGDRWVAIPAQAGGLAQFKSFTDTNQFASCLVSEHGTLSKGSTTTVNGLSAIAVSDRGDKPGTSPAMLYVATVGPAYPLRLQQTGPQSAGGNAACGSSSGSTTTTGTVDLSGFGGTYKVAVPSDALDLSGSPGG